MAYDPNAQKNVAAWMKAKGITYKCGLCGGDRYAVGEPVAPIKPASPHTNIDLTKATFPLHVPISCSDCGHLTLVDAVQLGF